MRRRGLPVWLYPGVGQMTHRSGVEQVKLAVFPSSNAWAGIEHSCLTQVCDAISHGESGIEAVVAVAGERDVNIVISQ